jgi:hypothetical protein
MLNAKQFVFFDEFFPKEVGLGPVVMEFYTQLVNKMVSLSEHPTNSAKWRERRSDGLKGLQSVCGSDQLFKKAAMERYGVAMVPVVLHNFAGKDEATLGKKDTLPSMGQHKGSEPVLSLKSRGQETLKALFTNLPSSAFKVVLSAVLSHLDTSGTWDQTDFVVESIKLIHAATPSSNHYILLASLLDRFKDVPGKLSLQHRVSLMSCLSYMVIQGGNAITLAHLELLEVFVKHLEWASAMTTNEPKAKATLDDFSHLLISSTGNLILSLSYPNQLNDMTHYLTSRLVQAKHKKPLLECVDALLSSRMSLLEYPSTVAAVSTPDKSAAPVAHAPISFDVLKPVLAFYNDGHEATRVLVFSILDKALKLDFKVTHSYPTEADTSFSADLKAGIQERLAVSNGLTTKPSLPVDFVIASTLLIHSCRVFGYKEVSRVVYFVLSLQDELTDGPATKQRDISSRQRGICNVSLTVLLELAKWLENKGLEEYFMKMKGERVASGQWEPSVEFGAGCVESLKGKTFAWVFLLFFYRVWETCSCFT